MWRDEADHGPRLGISAGELSRCANPCLPSSAHRQTIHALPYLSTAQTAATHSVVNALAVALCGLLAGSLIARRPL